MSDASATRSGSDGVDQVIDDGSPVGRTAGLPMSAFRRLVCAAIAAVAVAAGVTLALHHPLWPGAASAAFLGWCLVSVGRRDLWPLVVLAGLPLADAAPWSGWFAVEEFDLLVLGAIAGGHVRLAIRPCAWREAESAPLPITVIAAASVFVAASVIALCRGLIDAGGIALGVFESYLDPMNSLRILKPLLLVLLLVPLLRIELEASPQRTMQRVGTGMSLGLAIVALSVVWERIAYPGLGDFSEPYRAVGMFWEMHVGGAAIDAYFALAAPFAAWAVWSARTPLRWSMAAVLAVLATYAGLTTFSRAVYIAVAVPLVLLGVAAKDWPPMVGWRRSAGRLLVALLLVEAATVCWTGSFLLERMAASHRDLRDRIAHWSNGLRLLHDPSDLAFGIGLGRVPSRFTGFVDGYEFPGAARAAPAKDGPASVRLAGPPSRSDLAGLFALTQRVPLREGTPYRVEFDYRVRARAALSSRVCELHLLFERRCQSATVVVEPGRTEWQRASLALSGPELSAGAWFAPRMAVFELSLLTTARHVDLTNVRLDVGQRNLLRNGDFSQEMAHWFPLAQSYFIPWHVDNLYLEILIERGPLALAGFLVVVAWTIRRSSRMPMKHGELAPFLAASLLGAALIGTISSVLDASRSAFLLFFLVAFAAMLGVARSDTRER